MRLIIDSDPGMGTVGTDPEDGMAILYALNTPGVTVAVPGNVTPAAEFNIWMDPEAAAIVFASGAPITMVGLDVCHRTHFGRAQAAALATAGTALSDFVARAAASWIDVRERLLPGDAALNLYDTLAVAAAVEPDLLDYAPALVEIETSTGPAQGMTVTHRNELLRRMLTGRDPNARVAIDVDTERFAARFSERVTDCL